MIGSPDIDKHIRRIISPMLRENGFSKVRTRNNWAYRDTCIWIFNIKIALSLVLTAILFGCSVDTPIARSFSLTKGSEIEIQRELNTSHPDKELIFDLVDVPETKKDRDYSDFLSVTLIDNSGQKYTPEKISDVNGAKRDIIAVFNKVPTGTKLQTIRIRALQDIKGSGIRWWSGKLL